MDCDIPEGKDQFEADFDARLERLLAKPPSGWDVFNSGMYREDGGHETHHTVWECVFAAKALAMIRPSPKVILDVGSYRQFVLGLLANPGWRVHTLDVREMPEPPLANEERLVGDVTDFTFGRRYDAIVSLCTIEHLGLGRYGDPFDLGADRRAVRNLVGALRKGGHLVFTTTLSGLPKPSIWYNAHRMYTYEALVGYLEGLELVHEELLNPDECRFRPMGEAVKVNYDIYCGLWRKK